MTTWVDLEGIMLSKISQRQLLYDYTYMWNLNKANEQTKQNRYRKQTDCYQKGRALGEQNK